MQHTHRQPARCAGTRPPLGEEVTGEKRVTSEGSPEPGARRARCPHPAAQTAPGTGVSEPGPRHGGPLGSASQSGAEGSAPTRYPAAPCLIARRFLLKRKPYRFNRPFIWKYLTFLFFFFFFPPELFDIIVLRVRIKKTKKKKKMELCDSGGHRMASIPGRRASPVSRRLASSTHWRLRRSPGSVKNRLHARDRDAEDKNAPPCTALGRGRGGMPRPARVT